MVEKARNKEEACGEEARSEEASEEDEASEDGSGEEESGKEAQAEGGGEEVYGVSRLVRSRRMKAGGRGWRKWEVLVEWKDGDGNVCETWEPIAGQGLMELDEAARELARAEHGLRADGEVAKQRRRVEGLHACVVAMALDEGCEAVLREKGDGGAASFREVVELWRRRGGVMAAATEANVMGAVEAGAMGKEFVRWGWGGFRRAADKEARAEVAMEREALDEAVEDADTRAEGTVEEADLGGAEEFDWWESEEEAEGSREVRGGAEQAVNEE